MGGTSLTDRVSKTVRNRAAWRGAACLAGLALISACSNRAPVTTQAPAISPPQEAAIYLSHAHASYAPPGPPEDPWGPYIKEASHRFDVPDAWIREVMNVESGGYQYRANGELTTSPVGAMGLMQLMPETYDEMKIRYSLTDDAFDPHNNILAGTAYLREMYDAFGAPAFLAAYNAGPNRLTDYLENHRALPDETRRYVWLIGSMIQGIYPQSRSPNEQLALNEIPVAIPPGLRHPRPVYAGPHPPPRPRGPNPPRLAAAPQGHRRAGRHRPGRGRRGPGAEIRAPASRERRPRAPRQRHHAARPRRHAPDPLRLRRRKRKNRRHQLGGAGRRLPEPRQGRGRRQLGAEVPTPAPPSPPSNPVAPWSTAPVSRA